MSDEMSKLERMLHRATAAPSAPQPGTDPQEAALRKTWLAFGRLLEAAEASAPPQRPLTMPNYPRAISASAGRRRRRWLLATVSLVVAASLLIVVVAARTLNRSFPGNVAGVAARANGQKATSALVADRRSQEKTKPTAAAPSIAAGTHPPASLVKAASWDDAVDTQIAQVSRQMALVEQDWRARADSLDMVQYRLKGIEEEVGEGKF
jgi:hypothetical protein